MLVKILDKEDKCIVTIHLSSVTCTISYCIYSTINAIILSESDFA